MPFRNLTTLESWLGEFRQLGYSIAGSIAVVRQDGEDGADSGLVVVHLSHSSTVVYMEPRDHGATEWGVTLEQLGEPETLSAAQILTLSGELGMVSALCSFLQAKAQSFAGDPSAA